MLEFLIDNIYVVAGGQVFQQSVGISIGTNCTPLLADLFFVFKWGGIHLKAYMRFRRKTISCCGLYFHISTMFYLLTTFNPTHICMSIQYIAMSWKSKTPQSVPHLFCIQIHYWNWILICKWTTQLYDKQGDFNFSIVNYPYLCSNILTSPAYGIYISVCKSLFNIRSVLNSRQSTDKQVDVNGVSSVSFIGSFPHILRSLQRSSLPMQPSFRQTAVWCVSYQSLSRSW
jgi:hypothetical protein